MEENTDHGFEHHDQNHNYEEYDHANYYNHDQITQPQDQYNPQQPPQQPAAGPTQFSAQSAQINFSYQPNNQPNRPPARPVQYQQPNPVFVNPVHRPPAGAPYPEGGPQTKSTNPPPHSPAHNNMGQQYVPAGTPPHKAGGGGGGYHMPPGSPMKYSADQYGGPGGGYGGPNPNYGNQMGPSPTGQAAGFPVQPTHAGTEPWRSSLFDCMDDPSNALITALCPCITFGQVAEVIDEGNTTCATSGLIYGVAYSFAIPCIVSWTYRKKMRRKYNLIEAPASDLVTHILCEWCAVCQVYRELRHRGRDPAIGWEGNVAKMHLEALRNQVQMTPPMHERMMP